MPETKIRKLIDTSIRPFICCIAGSDLHIMVKIIFQIKGFPLLQSQHTIVIVTVTDDGRGSRPSVAGDMVFRSAVTEQKQHLQCLATNISVSKRI